MIAKMVGLVRNLWVFTCNVGLTLKGQWAFMLMIRKKAHQDNLNMLRVYGRAFADLFRWAMGDDRQLGREIRSVLISPGYATKEELREWMMTNSEWTDPQFMEELISGVIFIPLEWDENTGHRIYQFHRKEPSDG